MLKGPSSWIKPDFNLSKAGYVTNYRESNRRLSRLVIPEIFCLSIYRKSNRGLSRLVIPYIKIIIHNITVSCYKGGLKMLLARFDKKRRLILGKVTLMFQPLTHTGTRKKNTKSETTSRSDI